MRAEAPLIRTDDAPVGRMHEPAHSKRTELVRFGHYATAGCGGG